MQIVLVILWVIKVIDTKPFEIYSITCVLVTSHSISVHMFMRKQRSLLPVRVKMFKESDFLMGLLEVLACSISALPTWHQPFDTNQQRRWSTTQPSNGMNRTSIARS